MSGLFRPTRQVVRNPFENNSVAGLTPFADDFSRSTIDNLYKSANDPLVRPRHYTTAGISAVAPFNNDSLAGMSAIRRLATSGGGLNGQASETISNQMRGGDSLLSMRGGVDPGMEYLRGQMGARNSNLDGLESFTGNANPVLDRMYEQAARKMRQEVSAQFSRSGGYGSGYHQETMGRNLGDMATNLYGGAYESDANRRLSAAGQLAGFGESALNRDASNAGALSQMYGNNRARDIGITQQDIDNKYRAAGMAGQLDGNRYNDAEKLMGIGAIGEDRDALVRQEQASGYDFNRDADFNRQVQLSQAMQGLLGNYRTQNQSGYNTQTGFGPSIFNQGVGAISALASATASAGGGG